MIDFFPDFGQRFEQHLGEVLFGDGGADGQIGSADFVEEDGVSCEEAHLFSG